MSDNSKEQSPPAAVNESSAPAEVPTWSQKAWKKIVKIYFHQEFLILIIISMLLALAYPPLGAEYLYPEITSTWIAVVFTFLMAGLSLKSAEFSKAFHRVYFNAFVQVFNFGVVSSIVFGFSRFLIKVGALSQNLADGMVVGACLPLTINSILVMTDNAGGDEAAAIFNAAFGNMVGVFLSPVLILAYLGVTGGVDLAEIFYSLALRVILPITIGQILQKTSRVVVAFVKKYKHYFHRAEMFALMYIIYALFCETFENGTTSSMGDIFLMILYQFILLCTVMVLAWYALKLCFPSEPALRVMGLFGCTQKTIALGVPLINAIYADDPNVGVYTLPLLIWHTLQLVIGATLSPWLFEFVKREKERLGIDDRSVSELELSSPRAAPTEIGSPSDIETPNGT